jgi:hypothetical protein
MEINEQVVLESYFKPYGNGQEYLLDIADHEHLRLFQRRPQIIEVHTRVVSDE